jgi:zinc protease
VNRAKTQIETSLENAVKQADTRRNSEFVNPLISNFFDNRPYMEPAAEKELVNQILAQINAQVLSMVAAQLLPDENFVAVYVGPEKEGIATPTEDEILAAIAEVKASEIAPMEGEEIASDFIDPALLKGAKSKKAKDILYGAKEWMLSNGVKVVFLQTDYKKDEILFDFYKDGGYSLIPDADIASFDGNIISLFKRNSGVAGFSGTQLSKMLTGKTLMVNPYLNDLDHGIEGQAVQKDLEAALQLLYLFFTEPRFDQDEYQNGINQLNAVLPNLANQPNYKFQQEVNKVLYNDSPRHRLISMETVRSANLETLEKYYRMLFNDAAGATFVVVGDIDIDTLKPLVEKYIGSLPKGRKALKWVDDGVRFPRGHVEDVINVDMQTPLSTVVQLHTAYLPYTAERKAALDAISYVLDVRYTNTLREDEGGTYSASASASVSRRPEERMLINVEFAANPAMCDRLRTLAVEGIRELAANGPTDEEVNQAIQNLKKKLPERRQNNSYWQSALESYLRYGRDIDADNEAAVNGLTKEKMQTALQEVLAQENFIEVVMKPANTAEAE